MIIASLGVEPWPSNYYLGMTFNSQPQRWSATEQGKDCEKDGGNIIGNLICSTEIWKTVPKFGVGNTYGSMRSPKMRKSK